MLILLKSFSLKSQLRWEEGRFFQLALFKLFCHLVIFSHPSCNIRLTHVIAANFDLVLLKFFKTFCGWDEGWSSMTLKHHLSNLKFSLFPLLFLFVIGRHLKILISIGVGVILLTSKPWLSRTEGSIQPFLWSGLTNLMTRMVATRSGVFKVGWKVWIPIFLLSYFINLKTLIFLR